jgi:hypothetical protein
LGSDPHSESSGGNGFARLTLNAIRRTLPLVCARWAP